MVAQQYVLGEPPTDGISQISFGNTANKLLASSWDRKVYLYNVKAETRESGRITEYEHKSAVLCCCWDTDDTMSFSGSIDGELIAFDVNSQKTTVLGQHAEAIRCVKYCHEGSVVVTGSWDKTVSLWDPRDTHVKTGEFVQKDKVYALSLVEYTLVVGTADRGVRIYDIRNMSQPKQERVSSLKHQTRAVECHKNSQGTQLYVLASTEGRVAMEFIDTSPQMQKKKFAFKCHRTTNKDGQTIIFPVNTLAFHPIHGTLLTGGCDGFVNVWDGENKKRICQFPQYPTSIASCNFSFDGHLLAVASSYTWEQGDVRNTPPNQIFIRHIQDVEVRPKKRKK